MNLCDQCEKPYAYTVFYGAILHERCIKQYVLEEVERLLDRAQQLTMAAIERGIK